MNTRNNNITRILHWFFGGFVIVMLCLGVYMTKTEYSLTLYQWHKSLGVIFSLLIGLRLYWRFKHPWTSSPLENKYESLARRGIHSVLILLLFAMPVMGLLSSAYSGFSVHLFDLIIIPQNINASGEVEPFNENIYQFAKLSHRVLAYIFMGLIFMHLAAVFKHHFVNKDRTLINMLREK